MFVISRTRSGSPDAPEETIELAGSTGNIYTVTFSRTPSCTCPDARKGNQCKHIIYVLCVVLKAPAQLQYQLAFVSAELQAIVAGAPPIPAAGSDADADADAEHPKTRKPVEGDCPICFCDMDARDPSEKIVWCRAACGNNIHKGCFEQWAKSQAGREVRCVYCRSVWEGDRGSVDEILRVKASGRVNAEGYLNVGDELGLSRSRGEFVAEASRRCWTLTWRQTTARTIRSGFGARGLASRTSGIRSNIGERESRRGAGVHGQW
jgi:hypothetical protein